MVAPILGLSMRKLDDDVYTASEMNRLDTVEVDIDILDTVTIDMEHTMKIMESVLFVILWFIILSFAFITCTLRYMFLIIKNQYIYMEYNMILSKD
jgi:hypothetical protein